MEKILGLDLGTNSIGWAIRLTDSDLENQIIDKGVLTFDKGVASKKGEEFPMVQKRTESRGKRRNYQAEKYRKYELLETLIKERMCPLSIEDLNLWRHYTKGVGRHYPQSEKFVQWLRFDFNGDGKPDFAMAGCDEHESHFVFRKLAASELPEHKKIFAENPMLLGRVLYHLVQRRGFRGRDDESKEAKAIMTGSTDSGAIGVDAILPFLEKYKTLGAALYHLQKEQGGRIRKRYNLRSHYEKELQEICRVQGISEELHKKFWKAIIWQRPLRSQKGLVGYCTLESPKMDETNEHYLSAGKKRCPISHPLYEEYRTWVFINNLGIVFRDGDDTTKLIQDHIYPLFYNATRDFTLNKIGKVVRKLGGTITSNFAKDSDMKRLEEKERNVKVVSATLLFRLSEIFGDNFWDLAIRTGEMKKLRKKDGTIEEHEIVYGYKDIWHVLVTFDSNEKLKEFALNKLRLDEKKAEEFSKIKLQQGYATLSLSAISKLLPYLKQGFIYSIAVYLANMHKVLGQAQLTQDTAEALATGIAEKMQEHDTERHAVAIANSLISEQLNAGANRFFKNETEDLDTDDVATIQEKIITTVGTRTLEKIGKAGEMAIYQFSSAQYLNFLRKPVTARKDEAFLKGQRLHDRIFTYLQDTYTIPDERKKYLWHPSEQETYSNAPEKDGMKVLGDPEPISKGFKNPMALKTLYKVKGLMNYLLETGKIDEDTRIVVEIAREMNDGNTRKAIERYQREREKENDGFRKQIDEINAECNTSFSREDKILLDKVRLWEEQNKTCLYTGKIINACDLFNGSRYDIEHTIPAGMSFDNELKNLTLADTTYNRDFKKKQIPSQLANYLEDAGGYTAILPRIKFIEEKVESLRKLVDEWKHKSSFASTKDIKDACIQRKHMLRFELDYWRKKLDTFTCKEYKAGWRNSQLRDTQIVTKYALPYLKTVFKKVDVEKGTVTAAFRNIYNAGPDAMEKSRDKHSHHAIDAAILTLIPSAVIRDKILQRYNDAKDLHQSYHESVRNWKEFDYSMLLKMEEEILINFQPQHRILTETKKNVRKRGKQQFVKEKDGDGKWRYKLDDDGAKIPLIATGDTIRGSLHNDSFFAAIKQPVYDEVKGKFIPQTDGKGNFIFLTNEKRKDDIFFVMKPLTGLSYIAKIEDLDIVIDPNLRSYLIGEIQRRMDTGKTFAEAWAEPIWAFEKDKDKNGKYLNPIRNLRCRVKGGGGGFVNNPAEIKAIRDYSSKSKHKTTIYAINGETSICGFYQGLVNNDIFRIIDPISILTIAKSKAANINEAISPIKEIEVKKKKHIVPLYAVLQVGQKVVFYENEIGELENLDSSQISKRLYLIVKFEDGKISLKNHINAMAEDVLKKDMKERGLPDTGASYFDFNNPAPKLRLSKAQFNFAIEGKHFVIKPDGTIKWLF